MTSQAVLDHLASAHLRVRDLKETKKNLIELDNQK